jgi:hypothetical protein
MGDGHGRLGGVLLLVGAGVAAAYAFLARPRHVNWGARPEEVRRPMPLDDEIRHPTYGANRRAADSTATNGSSD